MTPSSVAASEAGKRVTVEGTLVNQGRNYFTDRRLVVTDTGGSSALPVRGWLPQETPPRASGPPVLSDLLGKKVVLHGTLREGTLRGFGTVKYLEVDSARAAD